MRTPRDINGAQLVKALKKLGYAPTRQSGSHIRLITSESGTHHVTIPEHRPIKIGTLSAILKDVAEHHGMSKGQLIQRLF